MLITVLCFSAKDMIKHRQKVIQLADSSELGWRVVEDYEKIPIASDSDDEKYMYKAEARASRKMKAEKSKRGTRGRSFPYRTRKQPEGSVSNVQTRIPWYRKPGLCFNCNQPGHWAKYKECPGNKSNNNISICYYFVVPQNKSSQVMDTKSEEAIQGKSSKMDTHSSGIKERGQGNDLSNNTDHLVFSPISRLKKSINLWQSTGASQYLLDVIRNGYSLPLKTSPEKVHLRNNKSARDNPKFVRDEICSSVSKELITECNKTQIHVINPLTVAYNKSSKPRLVLDCRHINPHLHKFKFKFEDIKVAEGMFEKGYYLFTYDLKGAYHQIGIQK